MGKKEVKGKASLVEKHKELYEGRRMDGWIDLRMYVHMIEIALTCTYIYYIVSRQEVVETTYISVGSYGYS